MRKVGVLALGFVLVASALVLAGGVDPVTAENLGDGTVATIDPIEAEIAVLISPRTLLLTADQSGFVVVHTDFPYSGVDCSTVELEGIDVLRTKADLCGDLVAFFDEAAVKGLEIVTPPSATLTLTGIMIDGTPFSGSGYVRVKE
ncbi:MAG: hypothetical protein KKI02_02860 [Planctomycetes bacterium]|nr:hypothetical protein [Planctomycetota bacterium]